MKAWHFLPPDGKVAHPGSPHAGTVVTVGQVLTVEPPIVPYQHGLHASVKLIDALEYASGPLLCLVELSGEIVPHGGDKHVASVRRVLAMANVTRTLHEFACEVAEETLLNERAQGREPDARSWAALETKRRWLRGEAWAAAMDAARHASWVAANAAARDAQNERLTALVLALPEFADAALLPDESEVCALRETEKQRGY